MSFFLLDTNIISELAKNKPSEKVLTFFESLEEIVVSVITIEEIEFGISRVSKQHRIYLLEWWNAFFSIPPIIVPVDLEISKIAGGIRAQLEKKGRKISQADALIAASAIFSKRVLVTRNVKDFEFVGVSVLNPF